MSEPNPVAIIYTNPLDQSSHEGRKQIHVVSFILLVISVFGYWPSRISFFGIVLDQSVGGSVFADCVLTALGFSALLYLVWLYYSDASNSIMRWRSECVSTYRSWLVYAKSQHNMNEEVNEKLDRMIDDEIRSARNILSNGIDQKTARRKYLANEMQQYFKSIQEFGGIRLEDGVAPDEIAKHLNAAIENNENTLYLTLKKALEGARELQSIDSAIALSRSEIDALPEKVKREIYTNREQQIIEEVLHQKAEDAQSRPSDEVGDELRQLDDTRLEYRRLQQTRVKFAGWHYIAPALIIGVFTAIIFFIAGVQTAKNTARPFWASELDRHSWILRNWFAHHSVRSTAPTSNAVVWPGYPGSWMTLAFPFYGPGGIGREIDGYECVQDDIKTGYALDKTQLETAEALIASLSSCAQEEDGRVILQVVGFASTDCFGKGCDRSDPRQQSCNIKLANKRATALVEALARTPHHDNNQVKLIPRAWQDNEYPLMNSERRFSDSFGESVDTNRAMLNRRVEIRVLDPGSCDPDKVARLMLEAG